MNGKTFAAVFLALASLAFAQPGQQTIAGRWDATIQINGVPTPFPLEFSGSGANVTATILRVDGDTGTISGSFRNGKFLLSHFDGARAHLLEVTPAADGTLEILQDGKTKLTAYRPAAARAKGLPEPTDPNLHTTM